MPVKPKTVPRKLRNGSIRAVDVQIIKWRAEMKKKGILLGNKAVKAKERNEKQNAEYAKPAPEKRKWF